ncbi:MAG: hypothetical protein KUG58_05540 [Marinosulfonomonas sp.]|nr:hypothetical protein [Marinosulfonomonas sp.]
MTFKDISYFIIAAIISVGFTMHLFHTADLLPTLIIGICALGCGIVFWLFTSFKHPTDPALLLPPYLITAALLMLHIVEEYIFDFGPMIAGITTGIWTAEKFLWTIGFFFPIIWIFGAYAIARRNQLGGFVSCFIFVGMLLGEPTHLLIFPIREAVLHGGGYDYFPGMWTALAPLITGIWGISIIVTEARKAKRAESVA